jgi:hypothetical protein
MQPFLPFKTNNKTKTAATKWNFVLIANDRFLCAPRRYYCFDDLNSFLELRNNKNIETWGINKALQIYTFDYSGPRWGGLTAIVKITIQPTLEYWCSRWEHRTEVHHISLLQSAFGHFFILLPCHRISIIRGIRNAQCRFTSTKRLEWFDSSFVVVIIECMEECLMFRLVCRVSVMNKYTQDMQQEVTVHQSYWHKTLMLVLSLFRCCSTIELLGLNHHLNTAPHTTTLIYYCYFIDVVVSDITAMAFHIAATLLSLLYKHH